MEPWDLNLTHKLVKQAFDRQRADRVRESARSVAQRQQFASYHYLEVRRLSRSFEHRYLSGRILFDMLTEDGRRTIRPAFERFILKAGAHSTAAVQCLHSIPDMLAHVAYLAVEPALGGKRLRDRDVNLVAVTQALGAEPQAAALVKLLSELHTGPEWEHLSAIANNSKHRSVVRTSFSEDLTGTRKKWRELQTAAFERGSKAYPSRPIESLLEGEHLRLAGVAVNLGHELNAVLQRLAA